MSQKPTHMNLDDLKVKLRRYYNQCALIGERLDDGIINEEEADYELQQADNHWAWRIEQLCYDKKEPTNE